MVSYVSSLSSPFLCLTFVNDCGRMLGVYTPLHENLITQYDSLYINKRLMGDGVYKRLFLLDHNHNNTYRRANKQE